VVLDNPDFIHITLLGPPCLEFQWHHHIPKDLASKSFSQTCGDLNVVVFILCTIYLVLFHIRSSVGLCLVGFKLLMAYFGQYCHCMAHTQPSDRPFWVKFLQDNGVMISPVDHNVHHQTYDKNFCIGSGLCNPVITALQHITENKWVWLVAFLLCSSMDVPVFNYLLTSFANFN
jgi:palmitoyl-[glycerolipid] 3-(E)-desaturase